jgi:hypothetical protein
MSDLIRVRPEYQPDLSDYPEHYAAIAESRFLPFSSEDPLIFHVLTTLVAEEEPRLFALMREGAQLAPRDRMADPNEWGAGAGLVMSADEVAGDGAYIFTTPCQTYSAEESTATYAPAVAFRLSTILEYAEGLAFRANDLEPHYVRVIETLAGEPDLFDDEDEDGEDEDQSHRYERARAENVAEELETVADFGTQRDADDAEALVRIFAESIYALLDRDEVPHDDPAARAIYRRAKRHFPSTTWSEIKGSDTVVPPGALQGVEREWKERFLGARDLADYRRGGLWRLYDAPRSERPELLIEGTLPLCAATFYRNHRRQWLPVPDEVCRAGLRANPTIYIPGGR